MPADDGLRAYEVEMPAPVSMEPADDQPEDSISASKRQPALRTQCYLELLSQQHILQNESRSVPEYRSKRMDEEEQEVGHRRSIAAGSSPLPAHFCPPTAVLEVFDLTPASIYWYGHEKLPETHALRNVGDDEILIVTTEFLR